MDSKSTTIIVQKSKQLSAMTRIYEQAKIGFILSIVCQPFEVMRTSSVIMKGSRPKSLYSLTQYIINTRGLYGLFRGSGITVAKNCFSVTIFFIGVDSLRRTSLDKKYGAIGDFFSGGFLKFLGTAVSSPLSVLKTRIEGCSTNDIKAWRESKRIWKEEGTKGFFKGLVPSLARDVPFSGIQYSIYKGLNQMSLLFTKQKDSSVSGTVAFINGGISSAAALFITYPFDNIRIRYQYQTGKTTLSFSESCKIIYKEEGIKGFFAGCTPRMFKKVVTGSIMWGIFESLNKGEKEKH